MLTRNNLHDHQNKAIELIKTRKKLALWIFLGGGKTSSSLTALSDLLDCLEVSKILVIAPLRVANSVWHTDAKKWEHLQHLSFSICTGTPKQRIDALNADADFYIINRENIPWLVNHYKSKWPFDAVVIDESDSFKSHKAQRWKALKKVLPFIEYLIELTGTPSGNGLQDLWAQIFLLDGGQALGKSKTAFMMKYFESDYMGYNWTLKEGAEEKIYKAIEHLVYAPEKQIYSKRIDIRRTASLPAKLMKQYRELEKEFVLELENLDVITALSAAAVSNKCLQFANGVMYDDEKNQVPIHTLKIEMLKEVVEEAKAPILVAYNYKSDLDAIKKHFPKAVTLDSDPETISQWNSGEIEMLLAHPASASFGLNLQEGGSIIVWYGQTWNLSYRQQFIARLDRQGQKNTVRNIDLIIEGTIDEKIEDAINNKAKTQKDLLDYMKSICKLKETPL